MPFPANPPAAQPVSYVGHTLRPTPSPLTIEAFIGFADVVARVCITGVSENVSIEESADAWVWDHLQPGNLARNPNRYVAVAEFRFEVIEWLKGGDGGVAAVGLAIFSAEPTEEGTRARGKHNFERRDKRWDNREAIVFMANSHRTVPSSQEDGRYFLGFEENYALDAYRGWLPLAHYSQVPGASCEPEFLLKDPWTLVAPGDAAAPSEVETLTLSKLKGLIALPAYELQKRALSHRGWWASYRSFVPTETSLGNFWAVSYLEEGVRLHWSVSDANPDVIGHRILRRARYEPEFTELADVPVDASADSEPSYDDMRDIQPETVYIYILRAYGADGDIADARIAITTIPALDQLDGEDTNPASSADDLKRALSQKGWTETDSHTPPETSIEYLTATTRFGEGIRLHWSTSDANPDVIGHRIMRRAWYEDEYIELADMLVAADGYYEDTQDLLPQTVYTYYIQEYGADVDSAAPRRSVTIYDARISITTVPYLDLDSLNAPPAGTPTAPVSAPAPAAQCEPPDADAPGLPFPDAPPMIEDRLLNADVVARVRLLGVNPIIYDIGQGEYENDDALNNIAVMSYPRWDDVNIDATELEFEVLEYLKGGDGSGKIWGIVGVDEENLAKSQVRKIREFYADNQDKIWDDREAIVILRELNSDRVPRNHYFMGSFKSAPVSYSLSSFGGWYPAAPADDALSAANPAERRFLLADPENAPAPASEGSQDIPAITLSQFRLLAALPDADMEKRINSLTRAVELSAFIPPETGISYLYATTRGGDGIRLYWAASGANPDVLGYRILRRNHPAFEFAQLADLPIATDGYSEDMYEDMRNIRPETGYTYILRAYGAAGDIADARISITTRPALEPLDAATAPIPTLY